MIRFTVLATSSRAPKKSAPSARFTIRLFFRAARPNTTSPLPVSSGAQPIWKSRSSPNLKSPRSLTATTRKSYKSPARPSRKRYGSGIARCRNTILATAISSSRFAPFNAKRPAYFSREIIWKVLLSESASKTATKPPTPSTRISTASRRAAFCFAYSIVRAGAHPHLRIAVCLPGFPISTAAPDGPSDPYPPRQT